MQTPTTPDSRLRRSPALGSWTLVVSLACAAPLAAQYRPDVVATGNGTRALALSEAVTAHIAGLSAIGWNPAGLATLNGSELMVSSRSMLFVLQAADQGPSSHLTSVTGRASAGLDHVEFAGAAHTFQVGGRQVTTGIAWRRFTEGLLGVAFQTPQSETRYTNSGGTRAISPSIATALSPGLRVGLTANFLHGSSLQEMKRDNTTFVEFVREDEQRGTALEFGAQYDLGDGAIVGLRAMLPHERSMRLTNNDTTLHVTRTAPLALAAGAVFALTSRERLSVDVRRSAWSSSTFRDDATGNDVPTTVGRFDVQSVHVGYERDGRDGITRGISRLGVQYRLTTQADEANYQIGSVGLSAGQSWERGRYTYEIALGYSQSSLWDGGEIPNARLALRNRQLVLALSVRWAR